MSIAPLGISAGGAGAFYGLLARLSHQHESDVAAARFQAEARIYVLEEENRDLKAQLAIARAGAAFGTKALPAIWQEGHQAVGALREVAADTVDAAPANRPDLDHIFSLSPVWPHSENTAPTVDLQPPHVPDLELVSSKGIGQSLDRDISTLQHTNSVWDLRASRGHGQNNSKERARIAKMFKVQGEEADSEIEGDDLRHVLRKRGSEMRMDTYTPEKCASIIAEMAQVHHKIQKMTSSQGSKRPKKGTKTIPFNSFADLILTQIPPGVIRPDLMDDVLHVQAMVQKRDIVEVIENVTLNKYETDRQNGVSQQLNSKSKVEFRLNMVVGFAVIASVSGLAISMDNDPESAYWMLLEGACACVFVLEACYKFYRHRAKDLLCGRDFLWEWSDLVITCLAVMDVVLTAAKMDNSIGKFAVAIRCLRPLRMARLIKLVKAPFMQELSNMLSGFLLGIPALFWVIFLVLACYGLIAMLVRMVVGPAPGEGKVERGLCLPGDFIDDEPEPGEELWMESGPCRKHELYGEEFFGTIPKATFTLLRCTFMDCASRGGQSLIVHFSHGIGMRFDVMYCLGMMVIIFGLFNVITAIFVETTMQGLKYDDAKRRFAANYESEYLERKLTMFVRQVHALVRDGMSLSSMTTTQSNLSLQKRRSRRRRSTNEVSDPLEEEVSLQLTRLELTKTQFLKVLSDPDIQLLLDDLDISIVSSAGIFEVCQANHEGRVQFPDMVETLMRLRGDLGKSDVVGVVVALGRLQSRLMQLEEISTHTNHGVQVTQERLMLMDPSQPRVMLPRRTATPQQQ